jgi:hypothetical protein
MDLDRRAFLQGSAGAGAFALASAALWRVEAAWHKPDQDMNSPR